MLPNGQMMSQTKWNSPIRYRGLTWKATPTDEDSGDESEIWKEGFGASSADGPTMHMGDATDLGWTQLSIFLLWQWREVATELDSTRRNLTLSRCSAR